MKSWTGWTACCPVERPLLLWVSKFTQSTAESEQVASLLPASGLLDWHWRSLTVLSESAALGLWTLKISRTQCLFPLGPHSAQSAPLSCSAYWLPWVPTSRPFFKVLACSLNPNAARSSAWGPQLVGTSPTWLTWPPRPDCARSTRSHHPHSSDGKTEQRCGPPTLELQCPAVPSAAADHPSHVAIAAVGWTVAWKAGIFERLRRPLTC